MTRHRWMQPLIRGLYWVEKVAAPLGKRPLSASQSEYRLSLLLSVLLIAVGGLSLRLLSLMWFEDESPRVASEMAPPLVERRDIVDRRGVIIARNLLTVSIYADGKKLLNADDAAKKLVGIFPDLNHAKLKEQLSSGRRFIWIKRNVSPREQKAVHELGIPGLWYINEQRRVYPHGPLFAHVVGYVDIDNKGIAGIENSFDERLRITPGQSNEPLVLSVDAKVQSIVREELEAGIAKYHAEGGALVVSDVQTGEVIALASLPDFDPHHPHATPAASLFNRTTLGVYEVGSMMKALTVAIGLDSGKVGVHDRYDVSAPLKIGRFSITDYRGKGGVQTVAQILVHSSNIGAGKIILDVGKDYQKESFKKLGLLDMPAIEVPEKSSSIYPSDGRWNKSESITMSYGYGISLSPVHVVQSLSALVNGGVFRPLTLLYQKEAPAGIQVMKPQTSDTLRRLLRLVITKGSGRQANAPGYVVGGKTGTANISRAGRYNMNERMSSFVAVFPIHEPRYIMHVMLENPQGIPETYGFATGGWTAAPVAGKTIARIAPVLGMHPIDETAPDVTRKLWIQYDDIGKKP